MKRLPYILLLFSFGCSGEELPVPRNGVSFVLAPAPVDTRADADNLATEYAIGNLSFFLAEAGSNEISYKYVYQNFSSLSTTSNQNPKLVTLPLTPGALPSMDVYVVANAYDQTSLDSVATVDDIRALQTARATPEFGFTIRSGLMPMYGQTLGANLNAATLSTPLDVPLTRAIAKFRVTLNFTDPTWVGTGNIFTFENCAPYTRFMPDNIPPFDSLQMIDYPPHTLTPGATAQLFTGIVYIFESSAAPELHILTTVGGSAKEYVAKNQFPFPVRNYLYDIEIQVLKPLATRRGEPADGGAANGEPRFSVEVRESPW